MLRALAGAGLPVPAVEGEHDGVLLLDHVANDGAVQPEGLGRYRRRARAAARADAARPMAGRSIMRSARSRSTIARAATGRVSGASNGWSPPRACSTGPGASGSSGWRARLGDLLPAAPAARLAPWRPVDRQHPGPRRPARRADRSRLLSRPCRGRSRHALPVRRAARTNSGRPMARASRAGRSGFRSTSSSRRWSICGCSAPPMRRWSSGCSMRSAPSRADSARRSNRPRRPGSGRFRTGRNDRR